MIKTTDKTINEKLFHLKTKYRYNQKVRVKNGFYAGRIGTIADFDINTNQYKVLIPIEIIKPLKNNHNNDYNENIDYETIIGLFYENEIVPVKKFKIF